MAGMPSMDPRFRRDNRLLADSAGIGLRAAHYREILDTLPPIGWLEVHSENFFAEGGVPASFLDQFRQHYPVSLHGVGLSLGSTDPLSDEHLDRLASLVRRIDPVFVSEHLCWNSVGGRFFNDLLPLPYTHESLRLVADRISQVQDRLGRPLLIENISSYLQFDDSPVAETEFLEQLAVHTGCRLLLDVNNVFVNASNHGFDAQAYLRRFPGEYVDEIHLAGHSVHTVDEQVICIDTHNRLVCPEVWALYDLAIRLHGPKPTLIEWDSDLPPLAVLLEEMHHADQLMEKCHERVA